MPAPLIATFAEKSGKSEKEVERLYNEVKKQVEKEYSLTEKDGERFYQLVVGILKKMVGISKSDAVCGGCGGGVSLNDSFCPDCGSQFDAGKREFDPSMYTKEEGKNELSIFMYNVPYKELSPVSKKSLDKKVARVKWKD